jgi:hypothetical protein
MNVWQRLKNLLGRQERELDLDREIRSHLDLEAKEAGQSGLSSDEARYAAQRTFGNSMRVKEDVRAVWGWTRLEQLAGDVRYGLRQVRRNPAFSAIAIATLALGIGVNTAMFRAVDAVLDSSAAVCRCRPSHNDLGRLESDRLLEALFHARRVTRVAA